MSPELVELVLGVGAIVAGVIGVGAHQYRKRNGKASPAAEAPLPQPQRTVYRPPGNEHTTSADDTGRLAALVQAAPASEVQDLIRVMRESIEHKPATQGDVQAAISEWGGKVRADINGPFRTVDTAVHDLRCRFSDLPCVRDNSCPSDEIKVPVTKQ